MMFKKIVWSILLDTRLTFFFQYVKELSKKLLAFSG